MLDKQDLSDEYIADYFEKVPEFLFTQSKVV